MKKSLLLLLSSVLCYELAFANEISESNALSIAKNFLNLHATNSGMQKAPVANSLTLSYDQKIKDVSGDSVPAFYVFNNGNSGFVIISGSDATKQILGYSDESTFDINHCPSNLKYWLDTYAQEVKYANSLPKASSTVYKAPQTSNDTTFATSISPLLGSLMWDQGSPYNDLCPVVTDSTGAKESTYTGCVATAMAQIMKYYNWPAHGTGSNSYTTGMLGLHLSLDFSKTTFDWADMTDTYSSSSTDAQKNAVATLMYNCGVSVNMDYNTFGSGAELYDAAKALIKYFGYDSNLQFYNRIYYTQSEWINILKTELNASRPIDYGGYSLTSGHDFVIDGYDSNGLFHINWGWSGVFDGYFQLSVIDPYSQGVEGGNEGYPLWQCAAIGVQKPTTTSKPVYLICSDNSPECTISQTTRETTFTVSDTSIQNEGINTFDGSVGLGIYRNDTLVQTTGILSSTLTSFSELNSKSFNASISSSLPDGNYQLYPVFKASTDTNWQKIRCLVGHPNYINLTLNGTTVNINVPTTGSVLTVDSIAVTGNLYQNKTGRISLKISNSGDEYNDIVGIMLKSATVDSVYQIIYSQLDINKDESLTLNFSNTIKLAPGVYNLSVLYDPNNHFLDTKDTSNLISLGSYQLTKNILPTPADTSNLVLTDSLSFTDNNAVEAGNAVLTAKIKNTSGFFDNTLVAVIFPTTGGHSLTTISYDNEIFDMNEEKTITFSGPIDLDPGKYLAEVYYYTSSGWKQTGPSQYSKLIFNLVDSLTGFTNITQENTINIYPNPANSVITVNRSQPTDIFIYDLRGKLLINKTITKENNLNISSLTSGVYIVKISTNNGYVLRKLIKN